jgi:hypothetical protein
MLIINQSYIIINLRKTKPLYASKSDFWEVCFVLIIGMFDWAITKCKRLHCFSPFGLTYARLQFQGKGFGIKWSTIGSRNSFRSPWELGKHTRCIFRDILGNRVETQKIQKNVCKSCLYRIPLSFKNSENESLIHNNGKKRGVKTRAQHSPETK